MSQDANVPGATVSEATASTTYDAQQLVENIAAGEEKAPKVDVSVDYERSKQFAVAEVDRTPLGEELATAATAPNLDISQIERSTHADTADTQSESTGNPEDFRAMAKDVNPLL